MRDVDDLDPPNFKAQRFRETENPSFWTDENWNDHSRLGSLQRPAKRRLVARMRDGCQKRWHALGGFDEAFVFLV